MPLRPWLFVGVLLPACGNSSAPDDAGVPRDVGYDFGTGRTIRAACEEQAASRCFDFEKCASALERVRYASEEACRSESVEDCVRLVVAAPDIVRPIQFIDRCTSSIELAACGDEARLKGCDPLGETIGPRAEGAPCAVNAQCFDGACAGASGGLHVACGNCYRRSRVGDPCSTPVSCTVRELGCDATGHCSPRPTKIGDACSMFTACPTTLFCNEGRCAQGSLPLGSKCDWTMGCAEGLACDLTCGPPPPPPPPVTYARVGESCASGQLCRGGWCNGSTCVLWLEDGESCMADWFCGRGSYCARESGKCTPIEQCG